MLLGSIVLACAIRMCSSITQENYYFPNGVKTKVTQMDWIECLQDCQRDFDCISYNYNKEEKICELNSDGVQDRCGFSRTVFSKGWTFHQIRPAVSRTFSPCAAEQKCDCNCGSAEQCITEPKLGDSPKTAAVSCQHIFEERSLPGLVVTSEAYNDAIELSNAASGAYYIQPYKGRKSRLIYCKMVRAPAVECGEGGWTLVMKIDGKKSTFLYNATKMWTENTPYNEDCGGDFSETETKLETFWLTEMTEGLCLGMKLNGHTNWLKVTTSRSSSLLALLDVKSRTPLNKDRSKWKSLINGSSMQSDCSTAHEGLNVNEERDSDGARARIGLIGFPKCGETAESRIGFGTGGRAGGMDPTNSCGNEASKSTGQGKTSIKAFCYILVK